MRLLRKTELLYLIIFILLITGYAKAEIPEYHKPIPCIGCHQETLDAGYGDGKCGNCHYYGLDVNKLQTEHNPKICTACHIGNTTSTGDEREVFHNGHIAVNCTECHADNNNFTILKFKSDGFKCVSCHGVDAHEIHSQNLNKTCPICHGSWAAGKVYGTGGTNLSSDTEEKDKLERFTIFNFIRNLFNALLGIR